MDMQKTNQERFEQGRKTLQTMVGAEGAQTVEQIAELFPDFGQTLITFGFGDLYSNQALDLRTREIITITSLITQGAMEQLPFHVHAALNVGLTPEELLELIKHCAGYAGFPKACGAINVVQNVFQQRGIKLPLHT